WPPDRRRAAARCPCRAGGGVCGCRGTCTSSAGGRVARRPDGGSGPVGPTLPPPGDDQTWGGSREGVGWANARRRPGRVELETVHPDVSADIAALDATMTTVEKVLDIEELARRVDELEQMAADPDLWNDQDRAQKVTS